MGAHDEYGKHVMHNAAGPLFVDWGSGVEIDYGSGHAARIDGTVGTTIAVEIESRVSKQIRGAVLDLICHRHPKKLLVILPVHMSDAEVAAQQCRNIMLRFLKPEIFRVVVLRGSGESPYLEGDVQLVKVALKELEGT